MKKTLFLTALALLAFGCSEGEKNDSEAKCGDGVVDTAAGEQCEPSLDTELTCNSFDASKKWKEGGKAACSDQCKIAVGTCVEDLPAGGVCGDGTKNEGEACDKGSTAEIACSEFDASKTWKTGGSAACADDCSKILQGTCVEDKGDDNPDEKSECGDGDVTGDEVCDTKSADTIACSEFDANKTWKEGGAAGCATDCKSILQGTCVEAESEPAQTCGDGHVTGDEVCDTASNAVIPCSSFDNSKTWKDSGRAACATDCSAILQGTCQEELCNNGVQDEGEVCDPKVTETNATATQACSAYDNSKTWKDGGVSTCKADCSGYNIGTCEEDTTPQGGCTTNDQCTGNKDKVCDTATSKCVECVQSDTCGDGKICASNKCVQCATNTDCGDASSTKPICSNNVCVECVSNDDCGDASSTKPICKNSICAKDEPDASCKTVYGQGIYWCQLIDVDVNLSDEKTSQTVKAYFQTGSDVTTPVQAKLVYDAVADTETPFKRMNAWTAINATVSATTDQATVDAKMATATLTKDKVQAAGTAGVYYTMKLSVDGTNWFYCKRNHDSADNTPSKLICDNKPFTPVDGTNKQSNHHEVGLAQVTTAASNIVTSFDFDAEQTVTKLSAEDCLTDDYGTKLCGTGANGQGTQCGSGNCIVNNDPGKALSVKNWIKEKPTETTLGSSRSLVLKNVQLGDAKNIFTFQVKRGNETNSPKNILVSYSADGTSYKIIADETLNTKDWTDISVTIPNIAANQTVTILITPYDGNNAVLRFDDLLITKGNE